MINNLSLIVFSKDRPLQLEAYLDSILYYSEIDQKSISVIYTQTNEISYQNLINRFKDINWVFEDNFFEDLNKLINKSEDYILFGCDDVIFINKIDLRQSIQFLEKNNNFLGFSLRLGLNITPVPYNIIEEANDIITWNWDQCNTPHWDYPWEIDSTIYRKSDILNILQNFENIKNPNYFESDIANNIKNLVSKYYLASFIKSKCIVLTVNRVQDDFLNSFDDTINTDVHTLFKIFLKGIKIDFIEISKKKNNHIHVGAEYLKLHKNGKSVISINSQIKLVIKKLVHFIRNRF